MKKIVLMIAFGLSLALQSGFAQKSTGSKSLSVETGFEEPNYWGVQSLGFGQRTGELLETSVGTVLGKGYRSLPLSAYLMYPLSDYFHVGVGGHANFGNATFEYEGQKYFTEVGPYCIGPAIAASTGISKRHSLTLFCNAGYKHATQSKKLPETVWYTEKPNSVYGSFSLMYNYRVKEKYGIGIKGTAYCYPSKNATFSKDPAVDYWDVSLCITPFR